MAEPIYRVNLARKRYVLARRGPDGDWFVVGGTVHALAGVVAPPSLPGRDTDRRPLWTLPVAAHALARAVTEDAWFDAPWDHQTERRFPVLRRFAAGSPATLDGLPAELGAHPFAPLVEGQPDRALFPGADPVVMLDPGDDLSDCADVDGLLALRDYAGAWARTSTAEDTQEIFVDEHLIRRVGRGGVLIDAELADPGAVAEDHEVIYDAGDAGAFLRAEAQHWGPTAFADRYGVPLDTAKKLAVGRNPSRSTVSRVLAAVGQPAVARRRCGLPGCDEPVSRSNAVYCSRRHADQAYRRRKATQDRALRVSPGPTCRSCGALMLGTAETGNGICFSCAADGAR